MDKAYNHGPLLVLEIARNVVGVLLIGFWVDALTSTNVALLFAIPFIIVVMLLFQARLQRFYQRLEGRFLSNLNARELEEAEQSGGVLRKQFNPQSDLSPWDAHIVDLEVDQQAEYVGKTLSELAWREKFGVNLAYIKRGDKLIYAPGRNNKLLPFDRVGVIATDEQMQSFKPVFDRSEKLDAFNNNIEDIILQKIVVDEHTKLKDQSIRSSRIRERTNGLVVGIERRKMRILNPESTTVFEWNDIVWIVGERKKIQRLNEGYNEYEGEPVREEVKR